MAISEAKNAKGIAKCLAAIDKAGWIGSDNQVILRANAQKRLGSL